MGRWVHATENGRCSVKEPAAAEDYARSSETEMVADGWGGEGEERKESIMLSNGEGREEVKRVTRKKSTASSVTRRSSSANQR